MGKGLKRYAGLLSYAEGNGGNAGGRLAENVSPEEIENKLSEKRIIEEVLVRESEGVIEAEIFPDYEYAAKKRVKDIRSNLQEILDEYNLKATLYKRIVKLKIRETEFEKNTTKKNDFDGIARNKKI